MVFTIVAVLTLAATSYADVSGRMETAQLAGPKPPSNSTHTIALTNNNGTTELYWIAIPRDWNMTKHTTPAGAETIGAPSYVNVYIGANNDNCQSSTIYQFHPAQYPCSCLIPFSGQHKFNEIFIPSEVQGFKVTIYGGDNAQLGTCNSYVNQLYQFVGCYYQTCMTGIAFFSDSGCGGV
ncbi:hypothetical protein VTN77DRAFT_6403 [Rasamsonia byssochlamydoides]|uniref:uncharacterized protein n=1 Tax=Rasamsonia byssochlamydoides TaxID=89139 RepID=UPI003744512E